MSWWTRFCEEGADEDVGLLSGELFLGVAWVLAGYLPVTLSFSDVVT